MIEGFWGSVHIRSTRRARTLTAVFAASVFAAVAGTATADETPFAFESPGVLDSFMDPTLADEAQPILVTNGLGMWIGVWASGSDVGGAGSDMDILFSVSTDNGQTFSAPMVLVAGMTTDAVDDVSPVLANSGSNWVVVWDSGGSIMAAGSTNGTTWSTVAALGAGSDPAVAMDASGSWVALSDANGSIDAHNGTVLGGTADVGAITDTALDNPSITTNGAGTWVGAVESDGNIGVSASMDNGVNWSGLTLIGAGSGPHAAFDGMGTYFVFWSGANNVEFAVSTNGTDWSLPDEVGDAPSPSGVTAANDTNGAWVTMWSEMGDIGFSTSEDNGISWTTPALVSQATATLGFTRQLTEGDFINPSVDTDASGRWIAIWESLVPALLERGILVATGITTQATAPGDGGGSSGPCFIASAAYGTPMAKDVEVLREMRDKYLLNNAVGLLFVDAYYQVSPVIADQVAQHPWVASLVRAFLVPVLFVVELFLRAPVPFLLMALFGAFVVVRQAARRRTA